MTTLENKSEHAYNIIMNEQYEFLRKYRCESLDELPPDTRMKITGEGCKMKPEEQELMEQCKRLRNEIINSAMLSGDNIYRID